MPNQQQVKDMASSFRILIVLILAHSNLLVALGQSGNSSDLSHLFIPNLSETLTILEDDDSDDEPTLPKKRKLFEMLETCSTLYIPVPDQHENTRDIVSWLKNFTNTLTTFQEKYSNRSNFSRHGFILRLPVQRSTDLIHLAEELLIPHSKHHLDTLLLQVATLETFEDVVNITVFKTMKDILAPKTQIGLSLSWKYVRKNALSHLRPWIEMSNVFDVQLPIKTSLTFESFRRDVTSLLNLHFESDTLHTVKEINSNCSTMLNLAPGQSYESRPILFFTETCLKYAILELQFAQRYVQQTDPDSQVVFNIMNTVEFDAIAILNSRREISPQSEELRVRKSTAVQLDWIGLLLDRCFKNKISLEEMNVLLGLIRHRADNVYLKFSNVERLNFFSSRLNAIKNASSSWENELLDEGREIEIHEFGIWLQVGIESIPKRIQLSALVGYLHNSSSGNSSHNLKAAVFGAEELVPWTRGNNALFSLRRQFLMANVTMGVSFEVGSAFSQGVLDSIIRDRMGSSYIKLLQVADYIVWDLSVDTSFLNTGARQSDSMFMQTLTTITSYMESLEAIDKAVKFALRVHIQFGHGTGKGTCDAVNASMSHQEFWGSVQAWSYINDVELIENIAFTSVDQFGVQFGRWNIIPWANFSDTSIYRKSDKDPCIKWSTETPVNRTELNKSIAGISIDYEHISTRKIAAGEVITLLRFCFLKFDSVELLLANHGKVFVDEVLSSIPNLIEVGNNSRIYISLKSLNVDEYVSLIPISNGNGSGLIQGVHVSSASLNNSSTTQILRFTNLTKMRNIPMGLLLQNCMRITEEDLTENELLFLSTSKYVICDVALHPREFRRGESKANFAVGSMLVDYVQSLRWRIRNKYKIDSIAQVMLRVGLEMVLTNETMLSNNRVEQFLHFVGMVNEFMGKYNIPFFISYAFDTMRMSNESGESVSNHHIGWWTFNKTDDLSDKSSYIERESEFLGLETQTPFDSPLPEAKPFDWKWILIAAVFVSFCLVIILFARWRRTAHILSKREAEQILYGEVVGDNEINLMMDNGATTLKFDRKHEIKRRDLRIETSKILGVGKFGIVCKGDLLLPNTETKVAVKIPNSENKTVLKSVLEEIKALSCVGSHENVVDFVGAVIEEVGRGKLYIVLELCENGSLRSFLRRDGSTESIEPHMMHKFSHEIASGMGYIASKKIIHGDLAARNVLLDSGFTCKISDFGLSRVLLYQDQLYAKKSDDPLPWRWMAVESLKRKEFSTKSDIWAFGVTLWEIYSFGCIPYSGIHIWSEEFVTSIAEGVRLENPVAANNEIYEVMLACWNVDPLNRPCFEELGITFRKFCGHEYSQL